VIFELFFLAGDIAIIFLLKYDVSRHLIRRDGESECKGGKKIMNTGF